MLLPQILKTVQVPLYMIMTTEGFPGIVMFGLTELDADHILQVWLFLSLFQGPVKRLIILSRPHYAFPTPSGAWQEWRPQGGPSQRGAASTGLRSGSSQQE